MIRMISVVFLAIVLIPLASGQEDNAAEETAVDTEAGAAAASAASAAAGFGGSGCIAPSDKFGELCYSTSVVHRAFNEKIQYTITGQLNTDICCKVFTCLMTSCTMKDIGCGNNILYSEPLHWEGNTPAKPRVSCRSGAGRQFYYDFTTTH